MKELTKAEVLSDHENHKVTLGPTMRKATGEHSQQKEQQVQRS